MIINIPIEPIPMRYSIDWDFLFKKYLGKSDTLTVYAKSLRETIKNGNFLDSIGTNYYKSGQLLSLIKDIENGTIRSGDILFFHDIWFPGIEQLAYIRDTCNIDFKIAGCLHAGSYDPNDFLYKKNLGYWANHFENCLFALVDKIFVATHYHKDLILKARTIPKNKISVTGFPLYTQRYEESTKKNIIVFPHRTHEEKHPEIFDRIQQELKHTGWDFVKTFDFNDKRKYLKTISESKIAVSFSDQETWGIAMQECVLSGCIPIVPNKLSYKEMYEDTFRYESILDVKNMILNFINNPPSIGKQIASLKESCNPERVINNIKGELYELIR